MATEFVTVCPACGGTSLHPFLTTYDFTLTHEEFHVEQCGQCELLITNPRPTADSAPAYYQSSAYVSHNREARGLINRLYLSIRHLAIRWKLSVITRYQAGLDLLDFGCGTGEFLMQAKERGYTSTGVEPSSSARATIQAKSVSIHQSLNSITNQFDVITLWHVLEHVYELNETIQALKSRLKRNGTIFIAVPNWQSYDAAHYQNHWAAYDVPRHIWHFSMKSMRTLLLRNQLRIVHILPMKLDAFYISLLSEKYKAQGKFAPLANVRAVWNGMRSNISARQENNYSSLLYVVAHAS